MNSSIFKNRLRFLTLALGGFFATQICQASKADEFKLKDGRTLVGQLKGTPKKDSPQWTVELSSGTLVRFPSSQLEINGHVKTEERIQKYKEELAKVDPKDEATAESHSKLAGWCSKNGLKEQEQAHYRRVLDFNPDDSKARAALNYVKDASGRWIERDEFMTEGKGKVRVGGRYQYPEVYAFNAAKESLKQNTGKFNRLIDNLQKDIIANNANSDRARAELMQINDPFAIPTLGLRLLASSKAPTQLKLVYIQLLSQFESYEAVGLMVQATLDDVEPQVRDACLQSLSQFGRDYAIASYIGVLRKVASKVQESPKTTEQLNRAAIGLNYLKAENAVLPLIEALITKFKMTRTQQSNFNPSQGLTTPGKPETTIESAQNLEVLNALSSLTRQRFSYDKQQWLNWYASVFAAPMGDLRRDP